MNRLFVLALRVVLVLLFIGSVGAEVWLIPQFSRDVISGAPELAYLGPPYVVLWIAVAVCAQIALVAVWMLLGKIRRGAIFTDRAFFWVDAIIGAGALASALVAGIEFHLLGSVDAGGPPLAILLTGMVLAGAAFVLVMLVMRGLLRSATTLQSELQEVV